MRPAVRRWPRRPATAMPRWRRAAVPGTRRRSSRSVIRTIPAWQFDQVSRNYIPAFYVHTIGARLDGKPLLDVETNFSLSENPVVDVTFRDQVSQSDLSVFAIDSKG